MDEPTRFHHVKLCGARSPLHARWAMEHDMETTAAMERGTAVHALVFGTRAVIGYAEGKQRRGKEWEAFEAAHPDAEILTAKDYDLAANMAEAVTSHPDAAPLLMGTCESTILWQLDGIQCRATPDARVGGKVLVELKSTKDAHPERFARQSRWMGYAEQLAWYEAAMVAHGEGAPLDHYIVAVEQAPPHPVTVLRLTARARERAQRNLRLWWERFRACHESAQWPAYVQSIVDLDVPDDDDELIFGEEAEAA